jgi:signal transduction histidine kinase
MTLRWVPQSLFARLLAAHLAVILFTLTAVGFLFAYLMDRYYFTAREWELTSQAENVAEMLAIEFKAGNPGEVARMAQTLASSLDIQVRVIDREKNEVAFAQSRHSGNDIVVYPDLSEIDHVLQGGFLSKKLYGPALQRLLVAIPIFKEEENNPSNEQKVIGAIIISAPLSSIRSTIAQISRLFFFSFIFAILVAGSFAFPLAKSISRPLHAMTQAALALRKGNFKEQISVQATGELGQLSAAFNQAVTELQKTLQEQQRLQMLRQNLVANVSHEFRAPLTSIQGFVDAMLEGYVQEEEKEKFLNIILGNTMHLKGLVDDLMEFASLESGYAELHPVAVSPESVAEKAMNTVLPQIRQKNHQLNYYPDNPLPQAHGDPDRIYQILVNLLENAINYTPDGGAIDLKIRGEDDHVIFSVTDNGLGIPAEELPHIWERFHKVDKARDRANRGKGLGLAIVHRLVQLHHGRVEVESELASGSTFSVILPVGKAEKKSGHH